MIDKLHGGVACAHCRAITETAQRCPICDQSVCEACLARDNCAAPRPRALDLGGNVSVYAVDPQGRLALASERSSGGTTSWLHDLTVDRLVVKLPPPEGAEEVVLLGSHGFAAGQLVWMVHDKPRAQAEHWTCWFMVADVTGELPRVTHESETWHHGFHHFAISSDGRWVIGADYGVKAYLYETGRFYPRHELDLGDQVVHSVSLCAEEDLIAAGLFGAVQLWALSDRRPLGRLKIEDGELTCLCLGAGKLVAISEDEVPHVVQIERGRPPARWVQRPLDRFKASGKLRQGEADLSPDGRLLAARQRKKEVAVFDLETGVVQRLRGHRGRVELVRFVAGGDLLLTADNDGGVRFWPRDGQRIVEQG